MLDLALHPSSQRRRVQRKVQHGEVKRLRGRVQGD